MRTITETFWEVLVLMRAGYFPLFSGGRCGGDERNRTADLLIANQTLSQLSYTPHND